MDQYVTEEQQVEAIKKWWQENRVAVVAGLVIGLAVVFGWQYWLGHRNAKAEQASLQYSALSQAVAAADAQQIRQQGEALIERFPKSFYAVLAAFELARLAAGEGDPAAAVRHLEWVLEHAEPDAVKAIARLRLARVLLASGRLDDAQTQLDKVNGVNFIAELEELKGDLWVARNEPAKARTAYQAALAANSGNALLRLKLDDLPASGSSQE